jgi:hypothetical protein
MNNPLIFTDKSGMQAGKPFIGHFNVEVSGERQITGVRYGYDKSTGFTEPQLTYDTDGFYSGLADPKLQAFNEFRAEQNSWGNSLENAFVKSWQNTGINLINTALSGGGYIPFAPQVDRVPYNNWTESIAGHINEVILGVGLTRAIGGVFSGGGSATAGSIRNVNPSANQYNCVNCATATDAMLAGRPASALPTASTRGTRLTVLEDTFNGKFVPMTRQGITDNLIKAGPGARGIIFGNRGVGKDGHVFNGVNQKGTVRFLDGQSGKPANWNDRFKDFMFLRTN